MHPSNPTPPPALFKRSTLLRWITPMLLISIALHGVSLLVPVPKSEEIVEEPEIEELEPIQISTLPPGALEPKAQPEVLIAPPPPPPPPPVIEQPEPELFEEVFEPEEIIIEPEIPEVLDESIEEQQVEKQVEEQQEAPDVESSLEFEGEQEEADDQDKVSAEKFDPAGTNPAGPGGLDGFNRFQQQYYAVDSSIVPHNLNTDTYSLDYIGSRCFEERDEVQGSIGVVLTNEPKLEVGVITISTGFSSVNNAILEWFQQMKAGNSGDTDKLQSTFGETLYDWILLGHKGTPFEGEEGKALDHEAYQINIVVDLSATTCQ